MKEYVYHLFIPVQMGNPTVDYKLFPRHMCPLRVKSGVAYSRCVNGTRIRMEQNGFGNRHVMLVRFMCHLCFSSMLWSIQFLGVRIHAVNCR